MLNWKFQQFTKTLFPKKQTPMRNKKNQSRKKLTPFIVLQEIHLPKYIYFYIYRYYFLKFKHPKFKRERKKKSKTSVFPTPSRICWSLLVQNQKELFTERRTGGGWECRKEEDEVVMGGEKTVELGPRRGEASLSSAGLFLRKTLRWGSVPSVPLPLCSVQGSCLSGSCLSPTPGAQCSLLPFSPRSPLVFPHQPASPGRLQSEVLQEAKGVSRGSPLHPAEPLHKDPWLAAMVAAPFPPTSSFCCSPISLPV